MEFQRFPSEFAGQIGDLLGEFWLGDATIRNITDNKDYVIRVEISYTTKDDQPDPAAMNNYTMQLKQLIKKSSDAGR